MLAAGPEADAHFVPARGTFSGADQTLRLVSGPPAAVVVSKSRLRYREELVQESFDLDGKIGYLTAAALQYLPDIDHYLAKQERYSDLMARRMVEQGRAFSPHQLVSHPCFTFLKMYVGRKGCLDGGARTHLVRTLCLLYVSSSTRFWELRSRVLPEGSQAAPVKQG
ncbi:MAG: hypothetical protein IPM88_16390 [Nitrospira sp.]|nr:hypothetical protein [Nitrospira sp.]